jgi:multidrug resistance protein, MATE family
MPDHETIIPPDRRGDGDTPAPATPLAPSSDDGLGSVPLDHGKPLLELLKIAGPSVATMSSYTLMQFVDTFMVKQIGPEPVYVAAQGNGGVVAWMFVALALGTNTVINSFVSQNLGAGMPRRGSAYAWNGMWLSLVYYLAVMVPAAMLVPYFVPDAHSPRLQELEIGYARILMFGAIVTIASRSLHHYFYGLHRPGIVLLSALAGNLVNLFVNAVLIFGAEGMPLPQSAVGSAIFTPVAALAGGVASALDVPAMGLRGAAIGTVLGGCVELLIPLLLFVSKKFADQYGTRAAWRPRVAIMRDILRVGWPGGLMMVNELFCWGMLMAWLVPVGARAMATAQGADPEAVEHAGTIANTAGWIALRYMHMGFMPTIGIAIGAQAMVGKAMGMGRPDLAHARAMLALKLALAYLGWCAVVFVVFRAEMIAVFINPETPAEDIAAIVGVGSMVMIAAAVFQLFDAVAIVLSGALRGAGDTVWPGVATVILSWTCIVGVGLTLIRVAPQLGSMGPWIGAASYIIALGIAMGVRYRLGAWRRMSLIRDGADTEAGGSA